MKYRIMAGCHVDDCPAGCDDKSHGRKDHVYRKGEVIETDKDLERFNVRLREGDEGPKFQRVYEEPPRPAKAKA
jgi:hypothetical protein